MSMILQNFRTTVNHLQSDDLLFHGTQVHGKPQELCIPQIHSICSVSTNNFHWWLQRRIVENLRLAPRFKPSTLAFWYFLVDTVTSGLEAGVAAINKARIPNQGSILSTYSFLRKKRKFMECCTINTVAVKWGEKAFFYRPFFLNLYKENLSAAESLLGARSIQGRRGL